MPANFFRIFKRIFLSILRYETLLNFAHFILPQTAIPLRLAGKFLNVDK
jgi:hypothetical protein